MKENDGDGGLLDDWAFVVTQTVRAIRLLDRELEQTVGLPLASAEVLFRLRRGPDGRLPTTRLARELLFSSGGFTKLADRLVGAGLVAREPCATDRRVVFLTLTEAGLALAEQALAEHTAGLRRHVLGPVGSKGLTSWRAAAERLAAHLEAHERRAEMPANTEGADGG